MTEKIYEKLERFYNGEVPGYITNAGKTFLIIQVSDWEGSRPLKITIADVIEYYATDARNILSGIRTIAGHSGDWRPIDTLAKEALEWFKYSNRSELARAGEKRGMILQA